MLRTLHDKFRKNQKLNVLTFVILSRRFFSERSPTITVAIFTRRFSSEKSPTITVANFFDICNKLDFQKAQRVPTFTILKILRFLSLGYSADLHVPVLLFNFKAKKL